MTKRRTPIFWFRRIKHLFTRPGQEWKTIYQEEYSAKQLFRLFFMPYVSCLSAVVFLLHLLDTSVGYSLGYALVYFCATGSGVYLTCLFSREILSTKTEKNSHRAFSLTLYSATVFLLFNSFSSGIGNDTLSQLFSLLSLIFLHTLYSGLRAIQELNSDQKNNLLLIIGLAIIFIPFILKRLLLLILHIPLENL